MENGSSVRRLYQETRTPQPFLSPQQPQFRLQSVLIPPKRTLSTSIQELEVNPIKILSEAFFLGIRIKVKERDYLLIVSLKITSQPHISKTYNQISTISLISLLSGRVCLGLKQLVEREETIHKEVNQSDSHVIQLSTTNISHLSSSNLTSSSNNQTTNNNQFTSSNSCHKNPRVSTVLTATWVTLNKNLYLLKISNLKELMLFRLLTSKCLLSTNRNLRP
mmetsp:Transcript_48162/g.55643  ORF Transcript_48162/g.55643 Transcript_48162/m.55643 type:complete len:221 (+) Transcript_48162:290-952(+)